MSRVVWKGTAQFRSWLRSADREVRQAVAAELYREGQETMAASKPLVPVDMGVLRASGTVFRPEFDGNRVSVTIGYGGAASDYALVQHERLDYHHDVGQAKYLEQPARARAAGFGRRVSDGVRKRLH